MTTITTPIPTIDDYRSADRAGKTEIRTMIQSSLRTIMDGIADGSIERESGFAEYALWRTAESVCIGGNVRASVPTDWNAVVSVRVATLRRAADMIESGSVRPNGIPDEIGLSFDSDATADETRASRIASESIVRNPKNALDGSDGAIAEFVREHMTIGRFYTMTEIAHMVEKFAPAYADRRCSPGAVINALRSTKNPVPDVDYVPRSASNGYGGRRTA